MEVSSAASEDEEDCKMDRKVLRGVLSSATSEEQATKKH